MYSYFVKYKVQVIISNSWVDADDTVYRQLIETESVLCNSNIYEIAPQLLEFAECDRLNMPRKPLASARGIGA